MLSELAHWMSVNAEAIYETRPWTVFGEGPTETAGGAFKENAEYTAQDIRFTKKGDALYAIALGEPHRRVAITSLGRSGRHERSAVQSVRLLGVAQALNFQQTDAALVVDVPKRLPTRHASVFRISFGT